jgi:hypothetical protein
MLWHIAFKHADTPLRTPCLFVRPGGDDSSAGPPGGSMTPDRRRFEITRRTNTPEIASI